MAARPSSREKKTNLVASLENEIPKIDPRKWVPKEKFSAVFWLGEKKYGTIQWNLNKTKIQFSCENKFVLKEGKFEYEGEVLQSNNKRKILEDYLDTIDEPNENEGAIENPFLFKKMQKFSAVLWTSKNQYDVIEWKNEKQIQFLNEKIISQRVNESNYQGQILFSSNKNQEVVAFIDRIFQNEPIEEEVSIDAEKSNNGEKNKKMGKKQNEPNVAEDSKLQEEPKLVDEPNVATEMAASDEKCAAESLSKTGMYCEIIE
jgi:hypothetical protein